MPRERCARRGIPANYGEGLPSTNLVREGLWFVCRRNRAKVISVGGRIVGTNFQNLGDERPPWAALDLNNNVERFRSVGLDREIGHFHTAL